MRIAFDHQIFGWQEYGGISRYTFELARGLSVSLGQEVEVVAPFYVNRYLKESGDALSVRGFPVRRLPRTGRLLRAANALLVPGILRSLRPDVVHETYYANQRLAPRQSKVVLTVYDMIHERFPESFSRMDPTSREKRQAVARADHVVCISRRTQKDVIELLGVDERKTTVVHLGFSLMEEGGTPAAAPVDGRPFLLYVGNRGGYKNFDGLIRAFAASNELRRELRVICFGGGPLTAGETRLLAGLGLGVDHVMQVSGSDAVLAQLYRHARAFVYPSLYEGFGIPPLEAMSLGCPVACSDSSSIPEVVGGAGAFFDPRDIDHMRSVVEKVVADESLRGELIRAGNARIGEFSWEKCARETLDVYRRIVS